MPFHARESATLPVKRRCREAYAPLSGGVSAQPTTSHGSTGGCERSREGHDSSWVCAPCWRGIGGLIVLDEPWEGLDPDAGRWLSTTIETKRDRGAAVVLSSHRLHDLAGLCDVYVFLLAHHATVLRAHDIVSVGAVTAAHLTSTFDRLRAGATSPRATA
jgi:hypothetical protein